MSSRLAGAKEGRDRPLAVRAFHEGDRVAVLDAEEEAGLELIDDDDAFGIAQLVGRNGSPDVALDLLQNGFAAVEVGDHDLAGQAGRGRQHGRKGGHTEKGGEKLLHGLNGAENGAAPEERKAVFQDGYMQIQGGNESPT